MSSAGSKGRASGCVVLRFCCRPTPTGRGGRREIAAAYSCRVKMVENLRLRCELEGFDKALERKQRATPPTPKILDGESEARIIALRLGPPPKGYANWSLRLLAHHVAELGIVESVSRETLRRTLKQGESYN